MSCGQTTGSGRGLPHSHGRAPGLPALAPSEGAPLDRDGDRGRVEEGQSTHQCPGPGPLPPQSGAVSTGNPGRSPCSFADRHSQDPVPVRVLPPRFAQEPRLWLLPFSLIGDAHQQSRYLVGCPTRPPSLPPWPGYHSLSWATVTAAYPHFRHSLDTACQFQVLSNPFKSRSDQVRLHKTLRWPQQPKSLPQSPGSAPVPPSAGSLTTSWDPARCAPSLRACFAYKTLPTGPSWPWSLSVPYPALADPNMILYIKWIVYRCQNVSPVRAGALLGSPRCPRHLGGGAWRAGSWVRGHILTSPTSKFFAPAVSSAWSAFFP